MWYAAFTCSSATAITLSSCISELSPSNDKDAGLNKQFVFYIDINKTLPDLLKLRTKAEKHDAQFSKNASGQKEQSCSKLCSWLMNIFIKNLKWKSKNTNTFITKNLSIYSPLFCPKKTFSSQQNHFNLTWFIHMILCLLSSYTSDCQETNSNQGSQIEVLLQRDFRLQRFF